MKLLFVNACMRGEDSRTLELCRDFISKFKKAVKEGDWTIEEVDLSSADIRPLDGETLARRDGYMRAGRKDAPMLALARQLIDADMILVGAPYWDLSFPAALKAYIEQCSVTGLTFIYSPQGVPQGQCRAGALVYLTNYLFWEIDELLRSDEPEVVEWALYLAELVPFQYYIDSLEMVAKRDDELAQKALELISRANQELIYLPRADLATKEGDWEALNEQNRLELNRRAAEIIAALEQQEKEGT